MDELIWTVLAVVAVLFLRRYKRRQAAQPKPGEPPTTVDLPTVTDPPGTVEPPPATLPVEPPAPVVPRFPRLRKWLGRGVTEPRIEVAAHDKTERAYQADIVALLNSEGVEATDEFVLPDGARVDVMTEEYAIEIDFTNKWAECIGQALYYGQVTNKKPVCLLLVEVDPKEPGIKRCRAVCVRERIDLWLYNVKTRQLIRE